MVFVVEPPGLEAVVQLAEELVEQVSLGLMVPVPGRAAGVEVVACTRRSAQRGQSPDRAHRGQSPVLDVPVQDNGLLAAGAGDRRRSGVGLQPARISEAAAVVSDFGEHPGAGQLSEAGKAGDDLRVRVLVKMGRRRLRELVGRDACGIELTQQRRQPDAHRRLDLRRLVQVDVTEDLTQPVDGTVEEALTAGLDQQPTQLGRSQPCGPGWGRRGSQDGACVAAGEPTIEVGERGQRGRVELLEQRPDLVADLLARPHRVLLGTSEHPDRLCQRGIGRQQPVCSGIGAQDVGQQRRVGGIGFRTRHLVAGPVAGGSQRVDRIDRPTGRPQRGHEQAVILLDRYCDRILRGVASLGQQVQQRSEPGGVVADSSASDHRAAVVDDGDIVVGLGPVDSTEQGHPFTLPFTSLLVTSLGGVTRRPNHGARRSVISLAVRDSSTPQDLVLSKSSKARENLGEVEPAADSSNGIPPPPPHTPVCHRTRRSFVRRRTPGHHRHHPAADQDEEHEPRPTRPSNPSLLLIRTAK